MFSLLQVHTDLSNTAAGFTVKFYCKVALLQKVFQPPCNRQPWSHTALGLLATLRLPGTSKQGSSCSKQPLSCSMAKSTCFRPHPFQCPIGSLLKEKHLVLLARVPPGQGSATFQEPRLCVLPRNRHLVPQTKQGIFAWTLSSTPSTPEIWWASHEHRFQGVLLHPGLVSPACFHGPCPRMARMLSPRNGMQAKTTRKVSWGEGSRRGSSKCGRAQFLSWD